jgi:protein-tyrosine phosphatase
MIDLHNHILPGIDDGAPDLAVALEMARCAAGDGVETIACTPHYLPGLFLNKGPEVLPAIAALQAETDARGIALRFVSGADVHLHPELVARLRDGNALVLAGSRYFLLEPPHHVAPPRLEEAVFEICVAGYVPIITHPERLTWIEDHYDAFTRLHDAGVWMQLTAGALTGSFGRRARYWSERFLDEGRAEIIATDAHDMDRRKPVMSAARDMAAARLGAQEAALLTSGRPQAVLNDIAPDHVPRPPGAAKKKPDSWLDRIRETFFLRPDRGRPARRPA